MKGTWAALKRNLGDLSQEPTFAQFTRVAKRQFRELGWNRAKPEDWAQYLEWHQYDFDPEDRIKGLDHDTSSFADRLRAARAYNDPYDHDQFLYHLTVPVTVEPLHGFVCHGSDVLDFMHGIHCDLVCRKELSYRWKLAMQKPLEVEHAVLLRHDYGETNYFHFHNDVLAKLILLQRFPQYRNWPWLVSRAQYQMPFFQAFLKRILPWSPPLLIQEETPIRVRELICLKGMGLTASWCRAVPELLRAPSASPEAQGRVFLSRNSAANRPLANQEQVRELCVQHGFQAVDTAALSLDEQIALFAQTRWLVAEHGAGLTNILFRQGAPLSVLELFPPGYTSECYYLICQLQGYDHSMLSGNPTTNRNEYRIDLAQLEARLKALR